MMSTVSLNLMSSFFTIAFASFVETQHDFSQTFSAWLKVFFIPFDKLRESLTAAGL